MPAGLVNLARRRSGVITAAEAYAHGITKSQVEALVRSATWSALGRGTYLLSAWRAPGGPTLAQRSWSAVLRSGSGAVVCGAAGWRLHGLDGAPEDAVIDVVMPAASTRHQTSDRRYSWFELGPGDVVVIDGIHVLSVERLLIEASRTASRAMFVSMLDSALHHQRLSVEGLEALRPSFAPRVADWIGLADGRSESALETHVRLIAVDGAVPPSDLNHTVWKGKTPIARIDLVWFRDARKVGLEADGKKFHSAPEPLYRDRARQAELTARGWVIVRVTWWDVINRPGWVLEQIRVHLYAAA